jgi:hypothetical protein
MRQEVNAMKQKARGQRQEANGRGKHILLPLASLPLALFLASYLLPLAL